MPRGPTEAQERVLRFIRKHRKRKGFPPSCTVIAAALEISRQAANQTCERLVRDGYLRKVEGVGPWIEVPQ